MSKVQLDDLYCDCDGKEGLGELNIKSQEYSCCRCGKILNDCEVVDGR